MARSFDVFFDLRLNKRLSKQARRRWFETLPCSLWLPVIWNHRYIAAKIVTHEKVELPMLPSRIHTRHPISHPWWQDIYGLVQERCNSIANALELRLSCTNPSICVDVKSDTFLAHLAGGLPESPVDPIVYKWLFPAFLLSRASCGWNCCTWLPVGWRQPPSHMNHDDCCHQL